MEEKRSVESEERPGEDVMYPARWERWLRTLVIALVSIGMGYLFFTNLWWKPPPDFACSEDFQFEGENASGLCFWVGTEVFYADPVEPNVILKPIVTDSQTLPTSGPEIGVPIGLAKKANAVFDENVVQPNIRWFGYVIWGTEAFVFLSLCLGFFSRLGALASIGMSTHLMVALADVPNPHEWEWNYVLMVLLSILLLGLAPGRYFGLDRLLRPRLMALRDRGSRFGRLLLPFT